MRAEERNDAAIRIRVQTMRAPYGEDSEVLRSGDHGLPALWRHAGARRVCPGDFRSETMLLYEYECKQCGRHTEKIQKFSDREITDCPHCGGTLERVVSAPAISDLKRCRYTNTSANNAGAIRRRFRSSPIGRSRTARIVEARWSASCLPRRFLSRAGAGMPTVMATPSHRRRRTTARATRPSPMRHRATPFLRRARAQPRLRAHRQPALLRPHRRHHHHLLLLRRRRNREGAAVVPQFAGAGTFLPALRASDNPIAIACFGLVTFPPDPLRSLPCFIAFISRSTSLPAEGLYLRPELLFDDFFAAVFFAAVLVAMGLPPPTWKQAAVRRLHRDLCRRRIHARSGSAG